MNATTSSLGSSPLRSSHVGKGAPRGLEGVTSLCSANSLKKAAFERWASVQLKKGLGGVDMNFFSLPDGLR